MRIISLSLDPGVILQILEHPGLWKQEIRNLYIRSQPNRSIGLSAYNAQTGLLLMKNWMTAGFLNRSKSDFLSTIKLSVFF
jgi:hypothetical protein